MQTVGGSLPLLIHGIWGARAESRIANRTGFVSALLPDSMHFTGVADLNWRGLISLGFHYRSDGSSCCTSKVKYWVTYLWILLILWIIFYIVLIQASEVLGMVGAPDESVFGSLLSKSWPNACWTRRMAEGFSGCSPALPGGGQPWSSILQLMSFVQEDRIFV